MGTLLEQLAATGPVEGLAVLLGLAYVLLARRRSRWCWVAGGAGSALLGLLAAQARLPMQAALQAWYVGMAVYGWLRWSAQADVAVTTLRWPVHAGAIIFALLACLPLAQALGAVTVAAFPYLDALTTVLSLFATWLVARGAVENWLYWIAIDAVLVYLFGRTGLLLMALLSAVYVVLAAAGWVAWRRQLLAQRAAAAAARG